MPKEIKAEIISSQKRLRKQFINKNEYVALKYHTLKMMEKHYKKLGWL